MPPLPSRHRATIQRFHGPTSHGNGARWCEVKLDQHSLPMLRSAALISCSRIANLETIGMGGPRLHDQKNRPRPVLSDKSTRFTGAGDQGGIMDSDSLFNAFARSFEAR